MSGRPAGDSDTRNDYDMIAARQELDLRPQLERLDRLILRSEGIDPDALTFAFRPLWQMDATTQAALALSKAQATQVYAGLGLWPTAITARLVEAQLVADGTYPNAAAVFGADGKEAVGDSLGATEPRAAPSSFWPIKDEPRDWHGRWMQGMGPSPAPRGVQVAHVGEDPYAGGDPDIEENLQRIEREQNPPLRIGPNLIPRERSDGTLEIGGPTIPPLLGPRFPPASSKPPPVPTRQTAPATPGFSPAPGLPPSVTPSPLARASPSRGAGASPVQTGTAENPYSFSEQVEDPQEKARQQQIRQDIEKRFENTKEHITDKDLTAAWQESRGDFRLKKPDGTPYDHVTEVKQAQTKLKGIILDLKGLLGRPRLLPSETRPLQDLLGEASRSLDQTEEFIPSDRQGTGDHCSVVSLLLHDEDVMMPR